MPVSHLDELVEKRTQIADHLDTITGADDFDPDAAELRDLQEQAERLDRQIDQLQKAAELRAAGDAIAKRVGRPIDRATAVAPQDLGSALIESRGFQQWKRAGASGRAKLMEFDTRALITTASVPPEVNRVYAAAPAQQVTLLASMNRQMVSSGSVEIVSYPAADPLAGVVPEGTLKPEALLSVSVSTLTLDTLAHWVEATRQVIEDEARLRDFIANSLIRGVYDKAEAEAAAVIGAGAGYHTATGETMLQAIRVGIALVNSAGYRPSVVLMHPLDAASLDYEVYVGSNGNLAGQGSVWGVPVVPNGAIAEGTAYVADAMAAWHHYYRGSADLFVTDSDVNAVDFSSNFKRNILTFLAEYRAKSAVVRPEAVAECTVAAPAGTGALPKAKK